MEYVIFDTNSYRYLIDGKKIEEIDDLIVDLKLKEKKKGIKTLISPIVARELLAHLANKKDPSFDKCLRANKAMYLHSGSSEEFNMIASPELLISKTFFDKTIPSKEDTNEAIGQISYHLATNPTPHVFRKFQRNLNLSREHVLDNESNFALTMKSMVTTYDPNATGWRIFQNDESKRKEVLAHIRSEKVSLDIAFGYIFTVYMALFESGQIEQMPFESLVAMAYRFIEIFPEPIALYKHVIENLVNSEFNLMENSRSNFVWDIHLMFNIGNHFIDGGKVYFVTSDKAIIRTAIKENAKYSILDLEEYLEYLK